MQLGKGSISTNYFYKTKAKFVLPKSCPEDLHDPDFATVLWNDSLDNR